MWPEALIDPAEDILVRERRASVTRRLRDSVPPSIAAGLAAEPPPLANHISETTPPGESPGFSREGVHHGVSAPTAGMHGEAAGKFSVSAPSQLAEHASQRFSSLNLRIGERSYSGSLLAAFSNTHATNQFRLFLESVLGDKQRSLTPRKGVASADDEHFETVLMQQLLFMLWGPPGEYVFFHVERTLDLRLREALHVTPVRHLRPSVHVRSNAEARKVAQVRVSGISEKVAASRCLTTSQPQLQGAGNPGALSRRSVCQFTS